MRIVINLDDIRDGNRLQVLAHRFQLTPRELAILVLKRFLNENYWEWNIEELYGKSADDTRIKGFAEYLNEYIDGLLRTEAVGKDFRKPKISIPGNQTRSTNRTNLGKEGN